MAGCYPLLAKAKEGEAGLGPYSVAMIFAGGAFLSTFVFNLFFMNLPIEGEPVDFMEYFQSSPRAHGLALLGGVIWCLGAVAGLVAASAENVRIVPSLTYRIEPGARAHRRTLGRAGVERIQGRRCPHQIDGGAHVHPVHCRRDVGFRGAGLHA